MLKHGLKLPLLLLFGAIAPASAERLAAGPDQRAECPYARARAAAAQSELPADPILGGGMVLGADHASIFAP